MKHVRPTFLLYCFHSGLQLVYRLATPPNQRDSERANADHRRTDIQWTITVVRRNVDLTWRLIFLQDRYIYNDCAGVAAAAQCIPADGYFDIDEIGTVIENETISPDSNPTVLFPKLPPESSRRNLVRHNACRSGPGCRYGKVHASTADSHGPLLCFCASAQTKRAFSSLGGIALRRFTIG